MKERMEEEKRENGGEEKDVGGGAMEESAQIKINGCHRHHCG